MNNINRESEFWRFMVSEGPAEKKSKGNYISWLRFVSENNFKIDELLDKEEVNAICNKLKETIEHRDIYKTDNDIANIKSALNKYCKFINSAKPSADVSDFLTIIGDLIATSKKREIEARLGQGKYRKELVNIWGRCSVTEYSKVDFLVASHIKPWCASSDSEKIDPYNGLLLIPNIDKLFDIGYISFDEQGKIIVSSLITDCDLKHMGIFRDMKLYKVEHKHKAYLSYHRENRLLK